MLSTSSSRSDFWYLSTQTLMRKYDLGHRWAVGGFLQLVSSRFGGTPLEHKIRILMSNGLPSKRHILSNKLYYGPRSIRFGWLWKRGRRLLPLKWTLCTSVLEITSGRIFSSMPVRELDAANNNDFSTIYLIMEQRASGFKSLNNLVSGVNGLYIHDDEQFKR